MEAMQKVTRREGSASADALDTYVLCPMTLMATSVVSSVMIIDRLDEKIFQRPLRSGESVTWGEGSVASSPDISGGEHDGAGEVLDDLDLSSSYIRGAITGSVGTEAHT